ncbi:MAG: MlaD family protein [Planctomycetales bacterium]|nr:MlaD family protein [Planctomycetales bacterium]
MDERILKLRVGIVVLAAAIICGILIWRFGDIQLPGTSKYTVFINFPKAPGVTVGTPVRKSGISIGRVSSIELRDRHVQVTAEIEIKRQIRETELCRIASASVLGDPVIEFSPGDDVDPNTPFLENGSEIDGDVTGNPLEVFVELKDELRAAALSLKAAGDEMKTAARNVNAAIAGSEGDVPRLVQKMERALDQSYKTLGTIDSLFGDEELKADLKRSLKDLPEMFDKTKIVLDKATVTFDDFRRVSERADKNLANLEKFTGPLSERGPVLVDNIDGILGNVNSLTEQLNELAGNFNNQEGTIGRLLKDDELYDRLERTMANVEDITWKLRPIVDDARVISDKVARDPSILGVRGVLDRRPVGSGNKLPTTETYFTPASHSSPLGGGLFRRTYQDDGEY